MSLRLCGLILFPALFALFVYWDGLLAWFQQDDFVWLGLLPKVHSGRDLAAALFHPTQHGTWRPLSERAFFLALQSLFGYNALPYRIWVFLTQAANFALIAVITRRITGSELAGVAAPVLWIANSKLIIVMSWTCEYILVLVAFFLLLAFYFLLRHIETGERRFHVYTWGCFLTGFLAMESNIVFPLLAASYTLLCARPYFRKTLPFFAPSAVFFLLHMKFAPKQVSGAYSMHFDASMLSTLIKYWQMAFEPMNVTAFTGLPAWTATATMAAGTAALLGFTAVQAWRGNRIPLLLLGWFVIFLLPVLPLRGHVTDYYLTLPLIALSMLGAAALAAAWRSGWAWRATGVVLAGCYFAESVPVARGGTRWWSERSRHVEVFARQIFELHERMPQKRILLRGVSDEIFWAGMAHYPFRTQEGTYVYLLPGAERELNEHPETGFRIADHVFPAGRVASSIAGGDAVVYDASGVRLRDVTAEYAPVLRLDVADAGHAGLLGPDWYPAEDGHRWMPRHATLQMSGPFSPGHRLHVEGYCPAGLLTSGPIHVQFRADGNLLIDARLNRGNDNFRIDAQLPDTLAGKPSITVSVDVTRTFRQPPDQRDLSLAFGTFEIR